VLEDPFKSDRFYTTLQFSFNNDTAHATSETSFHEYCRKRDYELHKNEYHIATG
jgi:hypothetical protein